MLVWFSQSETEVLNVWLLIHKGSLILLPWVLGKSAFGPLGIIRD